MTEVNEQTVNNTSNPPVDFDTAINNAVVGMINSDIREFQTNFEAAIDARIVDHIRDVNRTEFANAGFTPIQNNDVE